MSQPDTQVDNSRQTCVGGPSRRAHERHEEIEASAPRDLSAPLAFVTLPGVVHGHIASFLHERTIRRLWTLSRWTLESPEFTPKEHVLHVEPNGSSNGNGEYDRAACSGLVRLLSRGKGACTRVTVRSIRAIQLLAAALQEQPRLNKQLLELKVDPTQSEDRELVAGMPYLANLLEEGYLAGLCKLSFGEMSGKDCPVALLRTLGRGVCPGLEALETYEVSFGCLTAFVNAMAERSEGCVPLRWLKLQSTVEHGDHQEKEDVGTRLLEAPCLAHLESIQFEIPWSSNAVAAYLRRTTSTSKLTELRLNHFDVNALEDCGQDLALALAEGAAPLLETLCLIDIAISNPAISELCQSIKNRRILQHLRRLELRELFDAPQDVIDLMEAVGHGCPEVRSVRLWCDYRKSRYLGFSNAVAAALRASERALVHMEDLSIFDYPGHNDLIDLAAAASERPGGLPSLRRLSIGQEYGPMDAASMAALGEIIIRAPRIRHLELMAKNEGADVCVLDALGRSLAAGGLASQHLVEIRIGDFNYGDVAGLLRSFVDGACPRLQRFIVENEILVPEGAERWHVGQEALVALLAGQARCSATMRHLELSRSCIFDAAQASRAIDAINLPSATQLRTLKGLGSTAGLKTCMDLLHAYSGDHAGGRLHALQLHLVGLEDDEARQVADEGVRLIDEGAWPSLLWDWDQEELHTGLEVWGRRPMQHNGLQTAVKNRYLQLKHVIRGY